MPEVVCQIVDTGGSRWSVSSLLLEDELQWTTPSGVKVSRPLGEIRLIDFSGGKVVFLSDQTPESVVHTPYFSGLADRPMLQRFRAPRGDTNLESGPLRLGGKKYAKGLALHSRTEVVYRLPDRFRRFQAILGIDDIVRPHGNVRLVIRGDDRVLLDKTIRGTDPPEPIDLDISGVRRLTILADFGETLDVSDHLDLCEARVIK